MIAVATLIAVSTASTQEMSRVEVGAQTGVLIHNVAGRVILDNFRSGQLVPRAAIGGHFTFNLARTFALESEVDFLPDGGANRTSLEGGHAVLFVAGPKAGIRHRNFGVFGKARVGVLSFGSTYDLSHGWDPIGQVISALRSSFERRTHLALDLGGVFEYYPSKRLILRADASELMVRYGDTTVPALGGPLGDYAKIGSHILLTAGIGYRLGKVEERPEFVPLGRPRLEVGMQVGVIAIEQLGLPIIRNDPGVGARFSWNFSRPVAFDTALTFFPPRTAFDHAAGWQDGGSILQWFAGVKTGVRREHWGVFAKLRPGLMSYSRTITDFSNNYWPNYPRHRMTHIALDMGGVLEWYPTRRTIARLDVGDTTVFFRPTVIRGGYQFTVPSSTKTAIQVSSGFGFRF